MQSEHASSTCPVIFWSLSADWYCSAAALAAVPASSIAPLLASAVSLYSWLAVVSLVRAVDISTDSCRVASLGIRPEVTAPCRTHIRSGCAAPGGTNQYSCFSCPVQSYGSCYARHLPNFLHGELFWLDEPETLRLLSSVCTGTASGTGSSTAQQQHSSSTAAAQHSSTASGTGSSCCRYVERYFSAVLKSASALYGTLLVVHLTRLVHSNKVFKHCAHGRLVSSHRALRPWDTLCRNSNAVHLWGLVTSGTFVNALEILM